MNMTMNEQAYEDRMKRKAKREGKEPDFFLKQGAEVPTAEELAALKRLPADQCFAQWKERHGQHCHAFHFDPAGCARERTCCFLHMDPSYGDTPSFG